MRSLRLLPVTILVCALLLGVKCLDLGLLLLLPGVSPNVVSGSMLGMAEAATPAEPAHGEAAAPKPAETATAKPAAAAAAKPRTAPSGTPAAAEPVSHDPPGPPPVGPAERKLLEDLRGRRVELDAREKTVAEREGVLSAAEHQLSARIAELQALQTRLEQLDADRHLHDEANWAGIVKVYESMKPRDAATIFNDMEMTVLLQVMDRMKDTKMALVLAAMQPDRARLVTSQLAAQRTRAITMPDHAAPDRAGAS